MNVDVSEPLYDLLKKTIASYNVHRANGNMEAARQKAGEAANICRQIANMTPINRVRNLRLAEEWEAVATGTVKTKSRPNPRQSSSGHRRAVSRDAKEDAESDDEVETEEEFIKRADSLRTTSKTKWADIGGLDNVKQLMMETVVIAGLKKPEAIKPWKGILLFGPPGTGKTLLASAAAGSLNASFYNVKSSNILSKYFGESSKLITALFDSARNHAPSIVFIDEFDSLTTSRDGETSDASRTVLSTLLAELDGLSDKKVDRLLLTLAATNTPWDLDPAILSRFPRRVYLPLPDAEACASIIGLHTKGLDMSGINLKAISEKCVDLFYSGRDLSSFCQQAMWAMIHDVNPDLYKQADLPFEKLSKMSLKTRPLIMSDFEEAWRVIKSPLTKNKIEQYEHWSKEMGDV